MVPIVTTPVGIVIDNLVQPKKAEVPYDSDNDIL